MTNCQYPFGEYVKPPVQEYTDRYGYGNPTQAVICGKTIDVLPLAHPRQIGALGAQSERWNRAHAEWERKIMQADDS